MGPSPKRRAARASSPQPRAQRAPAGPRIPHIDGKAAAAKERHRYSQSYLEAVIDSSSPDKRSRNGRQKPLGSASGVTHRDVQLGSQQQARECSEMAAALQGAVMDVRVAHSTLGLNPSCLLFLAPPYTLAAFSARQRCPPSIHACMVGARPRRASTTVSTRTCWRRACSGSLS